MPGTDYIPEQGVWFQMKYLSGEMKILSSLLLIAIIKDKPNVKLGSMHVDVLCHECSVVITISLCEWPQPSSNFNHPPVKLCDCICKVEWVSPWNNLEKKKQKKQTKKTEIQLCGGYSVFKTTIFHSDTHTHTHTHHSLSHQVKTIPPLLSQPVNIGLAVATLQQQQHRSSKAVWIPHMCELK